MFFERKRSDSREGYFAIIGINTLTLCTKIPPGHVYYLVLEWYLVPGNKIFRYFGLGWKWKCEGGEVGSKIWFNVFCKVSVFGSDSFGLNIVLHLPSFLFQGLQQNCFRSLNFLRKKELYRLNTKWNSGQNLACAYFPFKGCVVCSTSSLWRSDPRHTKAFISFNRLSNGGGNRPADALYVSQMSLNKHILLKFISGQILGKNKHFYIVPRLALHFVILLGCNFPFLVCACPPVGRMARLHNLIFTTAPFHLIYETWIFILSMLVLSLATHGQTAQFDFHNSTPFI